MSADWIPKGAPRLQWEKPEATLVSSAPALPFTPVREAKEDTTPRAPDIPFARLRYAPDDRTIADIVNKLTQTARTYATTQQLRERLAHIVVPYLKGEKK